MKCQNLIRKFAYEQLKHFGIEDDEAKLCSTSCVSQRDIQVLIVITNCNFIIIVLQRVFTFYSWIIKTYDMLQA